MEIDNLKSTHRLAKKCWQLVLSWRRSREQAGNKYLKYNPETFWDDLQNTLDAGHTAIKPIIELLRRPDICQYHNQCIVAKTAHGECFRLADELTRDKKLKKNPYNVEKLYALYTDIDNEFKLAKDKIDDAPPNKYLTSWVSILVALDKKNNNPDKEEIRNFNKLYNGPILFPKQGAQPKVNKKKLIEWWNNLEYQWEVGHKKERDTKPTIDNQYNYGHSGTVAPDISGGVKIRRKDRKV
jgi:hypothetical protein